MCECTRSRCRETEIIGPRSGLAATAPAVPPEVGRTKLYPSVVTVPLAIKAKPKLTPLAPAGTAGVVNVAIVHVEAGASHGLEVQ
jgi:hypothetical protein